MEAANNIVISVAVTAAHFFVFFVATLIMSTPASSRRRPRSLRPEERDTRPSPQRDRSPGEPRRPPLAGGPLLTAGLPQPPGEAGVASLLHQRFLACVEQFGWVVRVQQVH